MHLAGWGRIINVSSAHGLVASPSKSAYCASKFGLVGLTKVVALETAGTGVTCNAVCPGWVLTPCEDHEENEHKLFYFQLFFFFFWDNSDKASSTSNI